MDLLKQKIEFAAYGFLSLQQDRELGEVALRSDNLFCNVRAFREEGNLLLKAGGVHLEASEQGLEFLAESITGGFKTQRESLFDPRDLVADVFQTLLDIFREHLPFGPLHAIHGS